MTDIPQTAAPAEMTPEQLRGQLRGLIQAYPMTSRSEQIRIELAGTIEAAYVGGIIGRDEFHSAMWVL